MDDPLRASPYLPTPHIRERSLDSSHLRTPPNKGYLVFTPLQLDKILNIYIESKCINIIYKSNSFIPLLFCELSGMRKIVLSSSL